MLAGVVAVRFFESSQDAGLVLKRRGFGLKRAMFTQFRCSKTRVWLKRAMLSAIEGPRLRNFDAQRRGFGSLSGPCLRKFDAKRCGFGLKRAMATQFGP